MTPTLAFFSEYYEIFNNTYFEEHLRTTPSVNSFVNFQILEKQSFPQNLKLADISPVCKKKDPTLVESYRPVSVLPTASKVFERIIQKQFLRFINDFPSPYLCGYKKGFNTQYALLSLIEKWKKNLVTTVIQRQC